MKKGACSALVGVVVVAWIAGGCGGGSEPEPLTKAAFIKQGNAICRQATKEQNEALRAAAKGIDGESSSSEAQLQRFVNEGALPSLQAMTEELGDLGVPTKDEEQVEAIVAGFEEAVEKMESDPRNALPEEASTDTNKRAESYGLVDCRV